MIKQWSFVEQWLVRILCALALLFVGFAHQPPAINGDLARSGHSAAYTLPDGTIPVLCLSSPNGKSKHDHTDRTSGCEACRLSASILLPAPDTLNGQPIRRQIDRVVLPPYDTVYRPLFPPNTSPRGPPYGLIA